MISSEISAHAAVESLLTFPYIDLRQALPHRFVLSCWPMLGSEVVRINVQDCKVS